MTLERWIHRVNRPVRPLRLLGVALAILTMSDLTRRWMQSAVQRQSFGWNRLDEEAQQQQNVLETLAAMTQLKTKDVERLKLAIQGDAQSRKTLFEEGLTLQEEKRLLEKQLEIMTTAFRLDPVTHRLVLLRAEQAVESYRVEYLPPKGFGVNPRSLRVVQRVTSKERFAHPERGELKEANGKLEWTPPQVGTSIRANALGEYVTFTDSGLILHGPPTKPEEHGAFPHYCLGLDLATARQLYRKSFIGTKIIIDKELLAAATASSSETSSK